jgi:hypothetical protein
MNQRWGAELPAAAVGDEEAEEEVVLRMRVDVFKSEHGYLESKDSPDGRQRNRIDRRSYSSMKIDPAVLGFSGSEVKNWPWRRSQSRDGRRLEETGSRLARVLGGGIGGIVVRYLAVASGELLPPGTMQSTGAQFAERPDRRVRKKPSAVVEAIES